MGVVKRLRTLGAVAVLGATTIAVASSPATADADTPGVQLFRVTQVVGLDDEVGNRSNGDSLASEVNDDGSVVVYSSDATNLPGATAKGFDDIYVYDVNADSTTRVTVGDDDTNGHSRQPSIDDAGSIVAFHSAADNLVDDDENGLNDVFVHDLASGTTTNLTVDGDKPSRSAHVSGDGTRLAYMSNATNLVDGDTNDVWDVFVVELATGERRRVSVASDGTEANDASTDLAISDDGTRVAFRSDATNLVDDGLGGGIFARDLTTGETTRVSGPTGEPLTPVASYRALSISGNGRFVAYTGRFDETVGSATIGVFVHDLDAAETTLVSDPELVSVDPSLSDDGSRVAMAVRPRFGFHISIAGLVSDLTVAVSALGADLPATSSRASLSGDGYTVTYSSTFQLDPTEGPWLQSRGPAHDVFASRFGEFDDDAICGGRLASIVGSGQITGTRRGDIIIGSDGPDVIDARNGNDVICGRDGDDIILAGNGLDQAYGEGGNDTISGGGLTDVLDGGPGNDLIYGGPGNDVIDGSTGSNNLWGGDDNDRLVGGPSDDTLDGGDGNDTLLGGAGNDTLLAGAGHDSVSGGLGADAIFGGPGSDTVDYRDHPTGVHVTLNAQADDGASGEGDNVDPSIEVIFGSRFDDVLIGSVKDDVIRGFAGNDRIVGREGDDALHGYADRDLLMGGPGEDILRGGSANDILIGGDDYDIVDGSKDRDVCLDERTRTKFTNCEVFELP